MYGSKSLRAVLAGGVCAMALATVAHAENRDFNVPAGDLQAALDSYAAQAGVQLLYKVDLVKGVPSKGAHGVLSSDEALAMLLSGTGLEVRRHPSGAVAIVDASDPQSGSAAGDGADGTVQALIVTAQKREENIQDVPIAMSAFTQEDLTRSQVAGGPDLMTQVPNFTFTKTNFTGYSIQIRGIGTQAISATTDPAVAVAFNNTPFVRNRFFEQEFYDLQRVEVLRGPQGTLYGRNATAGVVNIISAKPSFHYEAKFSADISNYNSRRLEGMINLPLVDDKVAIRIAGAWTKRDGYDTNQITGNQIDGRDLWSTRVSLRVTPTDRFNANLVWEHFEENDDRLRSGKQMCNTDTVRNLTAVYPDGHVVNFQTDESSVLLNFTAAVQIWTGVQGTFSQGCKAASLYSPDAFQTPNGLSLPYVFPLKTIGVPIGGDYVYNDPYLSRTQSTDLRTIESTVDPHYRAETNIVEAQFTIDLTDRLTLNSETGYGTDTIFSTQDFNRFNTAPGVFGIKNGTSSFDRENLVLPGPTGGIFCDPQIGCADRLVAVDLSTAKSTQFSQELRLASNFDGPFNFSLGANFFRYDTEDKYYVFINTLSLYSALTPYNSATTSGGGGARQPLPPYQVNVTDNADCLRHGFLEANFTQMQTVNGCEYMDPNPIGSLNDLGHNYFLSKNPYKLISYAVFGEAYYNITDKLKLTTGLRWTVDKKVAPLVPSWLLAADTVGYPVFEVVKQEWREPTGRVTLDWKPDLAFTDETLLYGSFAHGYKAGGMNPPAPGIVCYFCSGTSELGEKMLSATHPKTFAPEFVNAFEVGSKNTFLDGHATLNLAAFYYDYKGYQISQIINRSAINSNFDSKVWGLEIEADWRPLENLRLGFKGGYEDTRVADGQSAIDIMDRTAGHEGWTVVRPFPTYPSNCIAPTYLFTGDTGYFGLTPPTLIDIGGRGGGWGMGFCELAYVLGQDPVTAMTYTANPTQYMQGPGSLPWHPDYAGWDPSTAPNYGAGFSKDLSGNSLPNAPHFTATITADYTVPLPNEWLMTLHTDLYYQSEAWARIFNMPGYDKLKAYNNVNFAAIFSNEDAGWKVMAYVKNVFDKTNITGSFLNSDDTGLTTNVFLNEPRLFGLRVTKEWTGDGWWTGANPNHVGPYPLTIELGGDIQHVDAPKETATPVSLADMVPQVNPTDLQNRRLDWGDGRSLKITYRPDGSAWSVSGGVRYGRTNSRTTRVHREFENPGVCAFPLTGKYAPLGHLRCDPTYAGFGYPPGYFYSPDVIRGGTEWSYGSAYNREEHTIADFEVGRDVGIGALAKSSVAGGLRYADFKSDSTFSVQGLGGWYVPEGWFSKYAHHNGYDVDLSARREFKGAGPTLTWEAATHLWGGEQTGHLDLDWSVTGGVLFGKQKTSLNGQEKTAYYAGRYTYWPMPQVGPATIIKHAEQRTKSVAAPMVDLSLGLSYDVQRMKVSTGYRWQRYSNVLDAGYAEHKSYDRTIDGPYFKIAVGFGG